MKMLKFWTVGLFLFSFQTMAASSFDSIKEELWLKGESALGVQSSYLPAQASIASALENMDNQLVNDVPEELEVGLNMWLTSK
tara:strand:- start:308 stop:556 length:249 start_codon:yes stop_codon:yes gene_type:complete